MSEIRDDPGEPGPSSGQVNRENRLNNSHDSTHTQARGILRQRNDINLPRRPRGRSRDPNLPRRPKGRPRDPNLPPRPRGRPRNGSTVMTGAERARKFRSRRRESLLTGHWSSISFSSMPDGSNCKRDPRMAEKWSFATSLIYKKFAENKFGSACSVCDRLWFEKDLFKVKESHLSILQPEFGSSCQLFRLCRTCRDTLDRSRLPANSITNGFKYPDVPEELPPLNAVSARLISPRIPFMHIRRLRRDGGYGILGQVINIPVDVNTMVRSLPRRLDDDHAFNVSFKRKLIHKSTYLSGFVQKGVIRKWLTFLVEQPLYRHYKITIDQDFLNNENFFDDQRPSCASDGCDLVEDLEDNGAINEELLARQHTLLWNEENSLEIAPAPGTRPLNIIYDEFAEELSFPQIYYGFGRFFKSGVRVTPYMISNSEIRRRDRRGSTPEHILYNAMKILRLRVVDSIHNSFRCVRETENITRRMIEDRQFLQECVEKDFAFLKAIPNSVNYWQSRKKDLFAMMRQLGKPTVFLTLSANEMNWSDLLGLLYKLRNNGSELSGEDLINLDRTTRADLINEDPVTCCLYFHKLVYTLMSMFESKQNSNPFGKYRVTDYFLRIEFQHRGSPHAHILLWLDNDPKEPVSENMPQTIQLITDISSVHESDLPSMYSNQVHNHTFTCTKRGEISCRFNIPYWPMKTTRILLPLIEDNEHRAVLRSKAKEVRNLLETKKYDTIDSFLADNHLGYPTYLDVIRSTLTRPTVCFERDMSQIMTNTFHPWIAQIMNSNMDIQFILEEYSCASYVVDYVNKSNRGLSNLHRVLVNLSEEHPEMTQIQLLRKVGAKLLNTVEMSSQEAAWYLLRLSMSQCSRDTAYIPTVWPSERSKSHKTKATLDHENIHPDSTDIWTKSIIQHYEERPSELNSICLADFAAWYGEKSRSRYDSYDQIDNGEDGDQPSFSRPRSWRRREFSKIIRSRHYDTNDLNNFKREMVTLYVPFRNELVEILDRNKFIAIYDSKIELIAAKKGEYESGLDITRALEELRCVSTEQHDQQTVDVFMERDEFAREILNDGEDENFDDIGNQGPARVVSAVTNRPTVMAKEEYCRIMRTTNEKQRELICEFIHSLHSTDPIPIQIFFTGPAGCGKTFVLKLIMETVNRYSQTHNSHGNSYIACASTGKAAVGLGGTTVHSAFHLTISRRQDTISRQTLHAFRQLFGGVRCVIIDEVSMISNDLLHKINRKLQVGTGQLEEIFGGMNIIFCGDFRQLPPVSAAPVYRGTRNHIEGALLWQSLNFFALNEVMRQSDSIFATILTKIGDGMPLTGEESLIIESRFVSRLYADQNLGGITRLYHCNFMVDNHNEKAMASAVHFYARDTFVGYSTDEMLNKARLKMHKMKVMETGGLPWDLLLLEGSPYMVTSNVEIDDGLVNGAVGTLRYIENLSHTGEGDGPPDMRLWLEFPDSETGSIARIKFRPVIASHDGVIKENWTPILTKTANITIDRPIRCKRTQFPLTPAHAMTIHKSQGGTFNKIVVLYDKSQLNQLVYVALSRVKSIDGLYLINSNDDFTFYHKYGCTTSTIKEIRDEYTRLSMHPLETITGLVTSFIQTDNNQTVIVCTINAQSLVAHSQDIATDRVLCKSDIMVITETWMDSSSPVDIHGFELINCNLHAYTDPECRENLQVRRTAGGVAIYRNLASSISSRPILHNNSEEISFSNSRIGEISLSELTINGCEKFILGAVYIHPRASKTNVELFLRHAMADYTVNTPRTCPTAQVAVDTPMVITGDFNSNIQDSSATLDFMRDEFGLSYVTCGRPTTLRNTTIDLTFVKGLSASCMPFVAYFSDHRPLFTKLVFGSA